MNSLNTPEINESYADKIGVDFFHDFKGDDQKFFIDLVCPKKDEFILDMGSGNGLFTGLCLNFGAKVVSADLSEKYCKLTQENTQKYGICLPVICNGFKLPFANESFDKVVFIEVLEHIPKDDEFAVLKELYRVLKINGVLVLHTSPNRIAHKIYKLMSPLVIAPITWRLIRYRSFNYGYMYYGSKEAAEQAKYIDDHVHINKHTVSDLNDLLHEVGFTGQVSAHEYKLFPFLIQYFLRKAFKIDITCDFLNNLFGSKLKGTFKKE